MQIVIYTGKAIQNIAINNTYAPHHGYTADEINDYWGKLTTIRIINPKIPFNVGAPTIMGEFVNIMRIMN